MVKDATQRCLVSVLAGNLICDYGSIYSTYYQPKRVLLQGLLYREGPIEVYLLRKLVD